MAAPVVHHDSAPAATSHHLGVRPLVMVLPAAIVTGGVVIVGAASVLAQSVGLFSLIGESALTLEHWRQVFGNGEVWTSAGLSLSLAGVSVVLAVAWAAMMVPLVLASERGGRLLSAVAVSTVPIPHIVGAIAIGLLLSDAGMMARLVGADPGTFPHIVGGPWWLGVIAELVWKEAAFVTIVTLGAVARHARELDEAAVVLGAGVWRRWRRVTLPLMAPSLVGAGAIAFTFAIGNVEVPLLLGRTSPEPLPILGYRLFSQSDLAVRPEAMVVGSLTLAVAALALSVGLTMFARMGRLR